MGREKLVKQEVQQKLEKYKKVIAEFLQQQGFVSEEISYGIPNMEDKEAMSYKTERKHRYVVQSSITVRSSKIATLETTLQKSEVLIAKGISLESTWEHRPKFLFTNLNEIKPAMIQEANLAARKAAEQFAKDSNSQVGKMQRATQGLFSIEDTEVPTRKYVRVVTKVKYALVEK